MSKMDKEAEREKLRKQFEKEAEDRKSTEHMSELLLKGATMTNKHCNNCGDPIFRYQGQSFCPTCQTPVDPDEQASPPEEAPTTQIPDQQSNGATSANQPTDQDQSTSGIQSDGPEQQAPPPQPTQPAVQPGDDLSDVRASLIATLNSLAQQAQTTEDVGRTRELLQATKEAAEALSALQSITQ